MPMGRVHRNQFCSNGGEGRVSLGGTVPQAPLGGQEGKPSAFQNRLLDPEQLKKDAVAAEKEGDARSAISSYMQLIKCFCDDPAPRGKFWEKAADLELGLEPLLAIRYYENALSCARRCSDDGWCDRINAKLAGIAGARPQEKPGEGASQAESGAANPGSFYSPQTDAKTPAELMRDARGMGASMEAAKICIRIFNAPGDRAIRDQALSMAAKILFDLNHPNALACCQLALYRTGNLEFSRMIGQMDAYAKRQ
ncbi:MAG: hypothetical protein WC588_01550 [Candidatus Micrarchaeia archaeon]